MIKLMEDQKFYGMKYEGRTYDTGSKVGFLMANVAYALERPDLGPAFRAGTRSLSAPGRPLRVRPPLRAW